MTDEQKRKLQAKLLMNTVAKILNKIFANSAPEYIKKVINHDPDGCISEMHGWTQRQNYTDVSVGPG